MSEPRTATPPPAPSAEDAGIDTAPWWDTQLTLALLGGLVPSGWEKALGGPSQELDWWLARAEEGTRLLGDALAG